MKKYKLTRRDFLKVAGVTSASLALTACGVKATEFPTATLIPPTGTPLPTETLMSTPTSTPIPLEQLPQTKQALVDFVRAFQEAGVDTSADQLLQKGLEIRTITVKDEKQNEIAFVRVENFNGFEGDYPLMIKNKAGEWEKATTKLFAGIANIDWGASTTISYTQNWSPESTQVIPILTEHGNRFVIDYDLMMYNKDYPDNSVRPDEKTYNFKQIDLTIKFAKDHNLTLQAQSLLVSIPRFIPPWIMEITDPSKLLTIAKEHISKLVIRYPQIDTWCVTGEFNNPYGQNQWEKIFGLNDLEWLKQAFDTAHEANPQAKLYYTDFEIEFGGKKADRVFDMISVSIVQPV